MEGEIRQDASGGSVDLRALTGDIESLIPRDMLESIGRQIESIATVTTSDIGTLQRNAENIMKELNDNESFISMTSVEMERYMHLLRQLSGDDRYYRKFLNQMNSFAESQSQSQNSEGIQTGVSNAEGTQASSSTSISASSEESITQEVQIPLDSEEGQAPRVMQIRYHGTEVVSVEIVNVQKGDPLVFDLNGNGIELTDINGGVQFDLMAEGKRSQTAFVRGGDAFLTLDRNGNGVIDDGGELFGDQHGAADGFAELRKFDENHDGAIDAEDTIFSQLRLYADTNRDGISQASELSSLVDHGIRAISLQDIQRTDASVQGNSIIAQGSFIRDDGSTGKVADALLNYLA